MYRYQPAFPTRRTSELGEAGELVRVGPRSRPNSRYRNHRAGRDEARRTFSQGHGPSPDYGSERAIPADSERRSFRAGAPYSSSVDRKSTRLNSSHVEIS